MPGDAGPAGVGGIVGNVSQMIATGGPGQFVFRVATTTGDAIVTTPPGAPTGLTASAFGSWVTLSWTAPNSGSTPTSYTILAGSAPGLSDLANLSTGSTETLFATGGVVNGLYYLRVLATNAAGTSPASNEATLPVGPQAPGAPSGLAGQVAGTAITMTWNAPGSGGTPMSYVIEAGSAPGLSNLANFWTGNALTTFSTSGVPFGTYYLRVRATNGVGTSGPSNEILLVVSPTPAPGPPSGLTGSVVGLSLTMSWTAPSTGGAPTAYIIQAGSGPGQSNLANFSTPNTLTTFTANGVAYGTYYLRVLATNATGTSGPSNEIVLVVAPPPAPGPPSGLTGSVVGSSLILSWAAPSTGGVPTAYLIQAGSGPGQSNRANFSTGNTLTYFTANGLATGTYYVRVRSVNASGASSPSNEIMIAIGCTGVPEAPINFRISSQNGGNVAFAWNVPAGPGWNAPVQYAVRRGIAFKLDESRGDLSTGYADDL